MALYLRKANPLKYETIGYVVLAEDGHGPVLDEEEPEPMRPIDLERIRELERKNPLGDPDLRAPSALALLRDRPSTRAPPPFCVTTPADRPRACPL